LYGIYGKGCKGQAFPLCPQEERRYTNETVRKEKRRKSMQMMEVKWDDINKLDLWMLQNMGEDGYLFEVNDGRIRNILMSAACTA
jgi:hypothetical protein